MSGIIFVGQLIGDVSNVLSEVGFGDLFGVTVPNGFIALVNKECFF